MDTLRWLDVRLDETRNPAPMAVPSQGLVNGVDLGQKDELLDGRIASKNAVDVAIVGHSIKDVPRGARKKAAHAESQRFLGRVLEVAAVAALPKHVRVDLEVSDDAHELSAECLLVDGQREPVLLGA